MISRNKTAEYGSFFRIIRRITVYVYRVSPRAFVFLLVIMPVVSMIPFVAAWIMSRLIDSLVYMIQFPGYPVKMMMVYIALYVAILFFIAVIDSFIRYAEFRLRIDTFREFDRDLTMKVAHLDQEQHDNPEIRDLLARVAENSYRINSFIQSMIYSIEPVISVISSAVILAFFSPVIIFIILATAIPDLMKDFSIGERMWSIWDAKMNIKRDYFVTKNALFQPDLIQEIKLFNLRDFFMERIFHRYDEFQKETVSIERHRLKYDFIFNSARGVGFGFVFFIILDSVMKRMISVGNFSFYLNAAQQLNVSIGRLFRTFSDLYEHSLHLHDIMRVLAMEPKIVSGPVTLTGESPPRIELKSVWFKYPGTSGYVIRGINLDIKAGEHIAIVGENGAGKTTLLKLLMRFYDIDRGEILIDGTDIKKIDLDSMYAKIGALLQDFHIYHFNVYDNIGIGRYSRIHDRAGIITAAKKASAHKFIDRYPGKYNQVLDHTFEGGISPSFGQKQRLAIARCFFRNAPVLILDEPTSSLDPVAESVIFDEMLRFAERKTALIISHRFSTVRNASRIVVLERGRIIEDGTHDELISRKNGKYRMTFLEQKNKYR